VLQQFGDHEAAIRDLEVALGLNVPAVRLRRASDVPMMRYAMNANAPKHLLWACAESQSDLAIVLPYALQHGRVLARSTIHGSKSLGMASGDDISGLAPEMLYCETGGIMATFGTLDPESQDGQRAMSPDPLGNMPGEKEPLTLPGHWGILS